MNRIFFSAGSIPTTTANDWYFVDLTKHMFDRGSSMSANYSSLEMADKAISCGDAFSHFCTKQTLPYCSKFVYLDMTRSARTGLFRAFD